MDLEIINADESLSEEDLREIEDRLDVRLPEDYRQFMLKQNGGEFAVPVKYRLLERAPDRGGTGGFREFNRIWRPPDGELWGIDEVPDPPMEALISIAEDETGEICLCCEGENYGKVYYVDFDRGFSKWFWLVANSFTEFLESIHPREDADE